VNSKARWASLLFALIINLSDDEPCGLAMLADEVQTLPICNWPPFTTALWCWRSSSQEHNAKPAIRAPQIAPAALGICGL
jgi:hypothetical protein